MITVCYVLSTLAPSGPINQLYNTVAHFDEDRFRPVILTLSPEPNVSDRSRFEDLGVEIHSLGLSRLGGFIYGWSALRSFVAEISPDIIHSHGFRADVLSSFALRDYDQVSTIHTYLPADYSMLYGNRKGSMLARIHLAALRTLDVPVACSKSVYRRVQQHNMNPELICNGVDADYYSPPTESRTAEARQSLGLTSGGPHVVSVGGFIPRKDPKTLIRGFLESDASKTGSLTIVSDGPLRGQCLDLADGHPNIQLPGRVDDVRKYLVASDYFASASKAEGLPLAVLEALSTGLPVCLSNIEPHQDILSVESTAGVTFNLESPAAFASALDSLADTDYQRRCNAARRIVTEELSAQRMSEKYQDLYADLAI